MFWHIDTDIVGLLVMCALYYYTVKMLPEDTYTTRNKSFVWCLRLGIILTVIDIAASLVMDIPVSRFLYQSLMLLYMLTQNLVNLSWIMYALTILYDKGNKRRRYVVVGCWTVYAVVSALMLTNPWSALFFELGPNMEYSRGPLFIPCLEWLNYGYCAFLLVLIFIRRKSIPSEYPKIVLIMQPIILSAATHIQLMNPGWLLIYSAYMFCLLLAFLFFQNIRVRNERMQLQNLTDMIDRFSCGMSICHILNDGTMDIQYISDGYAAICETDAKTLKEHLSQDILYGVHSDDKAMVEMNIKNIISNHGNHEMTYRFISETGNIKRIHISAKAVRNETNDYTIYATFTDVTKLTEAEQLIDVALKNTSVSIWEYDFKRRCIIQYQNSSEMHGFKQVIQNVPESLVESGFVHPESVADFYEMYDKLYQGEAFAEGVFKVQTSDRKGYWYEHIRYTNSFDGEGNPYRAIGMSTDETAHQEALAKYSRELEKERGFITEENLIVHATFDLTTGETLEYSYPDGTAVPEKDRKAFTYGPDNAELLIDEKERANFLELNNIDKLLIHFSEGENEFRQEYRRKLPDGSVNWIRSTIRLLKDPHNGHILLFEYWYNIESEKMLELMYHSIATDNYDYVASIDGKTKQFNALPKEELSYHMPPRSGEDADEIARNLFNECVLPEDREKAIQNSLVENIRKNLENQTRFVFTYRMTRPDGSIRYKKITQYYIDVQREIIVVMREDITDLMQDENEKKQVMFEALEAANQASYAKSQFLSRVSHELRTPLNAIIGFMNLAKDAESDKVITYLNNSDAAAKQLLSVINDVLDMSSIEAGKLKIANSLFHFKRFIRNLTDLFEPQFMQKGLDYETKILTPIEEWLVGDQLRVNQILFNLLNNALKFTENGKVSLQIRQRSSRRSNQVIIRFEVSDTGCGMSEEMQKRLFHAFEQESAVTAQRYGGNGLGLSIVGNLVNMMDGVINVKSRQNEGSVFTVDLPFTKGNAEMKLETLEGVEHIHVLVADDVASEREYMSSVLSRLSVRHTCVESNDDVIAELARGEKEKDKYNVCIIDWKMPDNNGLDITRHIREQYGQELVILIVSAYDHYQADESVKAVGANMFVAKSMFQSAVFDLFTMMTNGSFSHPKSVPIKADLSEMQILLAEDNEINRMMMENTLEKRFGITCVSAVDGRDAFEKFLASEKGGFDVILMDIQMPNMDGYEATRQIRASSHPDAFTIPIIAVTANAFSEDVTKSLAAGMNDHISKPLDVDTLGAVLNKILVKKQESNT